MHAVFFGDEILPSYVRIISINHEIKIPINQSGFNGMSLLGFDRFYYMDNMFSTAVIVFSRWFINLSFGRRSIRNGFRICRIPGLFSASWNAVILCFERCWKKAKHTLGGWQLKHFLCSPVHPYLGKWSSLTNIFQMGWNHQLDTSLKSSMILILLMVQKSCTSWSGFCLNLYKNWRRPKMSEPSTVGLGNTPFVVGSQKMPGPNLKIDPCQSWTSHQNSLYWFSKTLWGWLPAPRNFPP